MSADGWYGPALDNWAASDGGPFTGPVTIGVLHTTESPRGAFRPQPNSFFGHTSYPHLTVDVQGGVFQCWQHISIRKAAKALRNAPGGVETNREGVIQIEVVGSAVAPFTDNPVLVAGLAKLMRWIESQTQIAPRSSVRFLSYPASYGNSPVRMSNAAWAGYSGWCGHQHAAENDHGDPGAIDINLLLPTRAPKAPPALKLPPAFAPPAAPPIPLENLMAATARYTPGDGAQYITDGISTRWLQDEVEVQALGGLGLLGPMQKLDAKVHARLILVGPKAPTKP